jgi:hypothetical protein
MIRLVLAIVVSLVIGAAAGALLTPAHYSFVLHQGTGLLYRCNRITGQVDVAAGRANPWHTIPSLRDLSDEELLKLK